MWNKNIVFACVLAATVAFNPFHAQAQSKRKKPQKVVLSEEEQKHIQRMAEMEVATQKIIVVDSVVTDKDALLSVLNLPVEAGRIEQASSIFGEGFDGVAYITELGDRCIFSKADDKGKRQLWQCDKLDGVWSEPKMIDFGGDTGFGDVDFPFMMADGSTLYFAAKGGDGIGGYDIYVTRFNADDNNYYKPENIGMPFCSESNDFLYVVDEYDNIGWFVTDRRQPEGKVCIYTFIPTETREVYSDDIDEEKLTSLSRLFSISDTWGDGNERNAAIMRIGEMAVRQSAASDSKKSDMAFVINDNTVYNNPQQFRAEGNIARYDELRSAIGNLERIRNSLEKSRLYYSKANDSDRDSLRQEIHADEQREEDLEMKIKQLEKEIRNAENKEILR